MFDEGAEAIQLLGPEHFVMTQPRKRPRGRPVPQCAADDPPGLSSRNQAGLLEDADVLDEAGERHAVRRRQLAYRSLAVAELRQHCTARGVGQGAEHGIEGQRPMVNHTV